MEKIRCVVERITYQNPENGYTVLKVNVKGFEELVTLIGNLVDANVGSVLIAEGFWKNDKKYGTQFIAEKWEETVPSTVYGLEKYLSSGLIKGLGPTFAKRIVDLFGMDTIGIIENSPERLFEVSGIGKKRVETICESWEKQKEIKNIMLFLQGHDVSTAFAVKIYKQYGNESIDVVTENPFRLADDIWGIGFKTADTIASKLGFPKDCYVRIRSGISYTLNELSKDGHVYAEVDQLVSSASQLLSASEKSIRDAIGKMCDTLDLIKEDEVYYLPSFYYSEKGVASRLIEVLLSKPNQKVIPKIDFDKLQKATGIEYDDIQKQAIITSTTSKIMVLTGGPGTGKTTTVLGIIKVLSALNLRILLAAPTGRAAKRLSETTGMEAKTIHRLLEANPTDGYNRNDKNPLEGDVLILDESSMIDIILMNSLMKAIPKTMKLIFVGDIDQLPSVGPGNVLNDIIDCGKFPVIRLTKVFRQAQKSMIITNAHRINEGKGIIRNNSKGSDFFFLEADDSNAVDMIIDLVSQRLPSHLMISPADIQVLSPMKNGIVGTQALNEKLQDKLNPSNDNLYRTGRRFRKNDKVMQIKNNYDKDVFNGDIGIIENIDLINKELIVRFDEKSVLYDVSDLDELVPAYAITIHKSQGSEYPVVIIPVMMCHYVMLQRNLLYTGITRAKKYLILVGSTKAISKTINNITVSKRNTRLRQRLENFQY